MNYFQTAWAFENNLVINAEDKRKNHDTDISRWVKKKQQLDYLPWGISKSLLHSYNPDLEVGFEQDTNGHPYFKTESGVYLMAFVFDKTTGKRTPAMLYAVRGFGNKAEPNPGVDLISNATQRAYSKVIAQEVGFGWSLYSRLDESIDLDDETHTAPPRPTSKAPVATSNGIKPKAQKDEFDF